MSPDDWFVQLSELLPPAPDGGPGYALDAPERELLLDLARIAAHTSQRWTAPLSTFLAGVAFATTPSDERVAALRDLVAALEPEAT